MTRPRSDAQGEGIYRGSRESTRGQDGWRHEEPDGGSPASVDPRSMLGFPSVTAEVDGATALEFETPAWAADTPPPSARGGRET